MSMDRQVGAVRADQRQQLRGLATSPDDIEAGAGEQAGQALA